MISVKRPKLLSFLAYINFLEGAFLLTFIIIILFLNGFDSIRNQSIISIILMGFLLIMPPIIGVGLLRGSTWGWWGEFFLLIIPVYQFLMQLFLQKAVFFEALFGLSVSICLIIYIFTKNVRAFFMTGKMRK